MAATKIRRGSLVILTRTYPLDINDADSPKIVRGTCVRVTKVEQSKLWPGQRNYYVTDGAIEIGPIGISVLKATDC